jgi:hypothetical protein
VPGSTRCALGVAMPDVGGFERADQLALVPGLRMPLRFPRPDVVSPCLVRGDATPLPVDVVLWIRSHREDRAMSP